MTTKARRRVTQKQLGPYIHCSVPTVLPVKAHPGVIRQWMRSGDLESLESVVIEGQGHKLLGEYTPDLKVRAFLKTVPAYLARIDMVHEAAAKGNLQDLQTLLKNTDNVFTKKRLEKIALSKDLSGTGVLHKAVYYEYKDMVSWVLNNFPNTVHARDREGRTALHYSGHCRDKEWMWTAVSQAGADTTLVDCQLHTPGYYMEHPQQAKLPTVPEALSASRFSNNNQELVVKPANIRIWIHDQDLGRLQQVVWEGYGDKLRTETSQHPTVRQFLTAVPYIMGVIRDVHSASVKNDLILLKRRTDNPVPKEIFLTKDLNGLTPLHKAAGLGHLQTVKAILSACPEAVSMTDREGRTALHYAAVAKGSGATYDALLQYGALENVLDKRDKTPGYYIQNPKEVDTKVLSVVPEAPRTASIFPPSWDWALIRGQGEVEGGKQLPPPPASTNGDSAFEEMSQDSPTKQSPPSLTSKIPVPIPINQVEEKLSRPQTYDLDVDEGVEEDEEEKGYNADSDEQEGHYEAEYAEVDPEFGLENQPARPTEEPLKPGYADDVTRGKERRSEETAGTTIARGVNRLGNVRNKHNTRDKPRPNFQTVVKSTSNSVAEEKDNFKPKVKPKRKVTKGVTKGVKETGEGMKSVENNLNQMIYSIDKTMSDTKRDILLTKDFLEGEKNTLIKESETSIANVKKKAEKKLGAIIKESDNAISDLKRKAEKNVGSVIEESSKLANTVNKESKEMVDSIKTKSNELVDSLKTDSEKAMESVNSKSNKVVTTAVDETEKMIVSMKKKSDDVVKSLNKSKQIVESAKTESENVLKTMTQDTKKAIDSSEKKVKDIERKVVNKFKKNTNKLNNKINTIIKDTSEKSTGILKKEKDKLNNSIENVLVGKKLTDAILDSPKKKAKNNDKTKDNSIKEKIDATRNFINMEKEYATKSLPDNVDTPVKKTNKTVKFKENEVNLNKSSPTKVKSNPKHDNQANLNKNSPTKVKSNPKLDKQTTQKPNIAKAGKSENQKENANKSPTKAGIAVVGAGIALGSVLAGTQKKKSINIENLEKNSSILNKDIEKDQNYEYASNSSTSTNTASTLPQDNLPKVAKTEGRFTVYKPAEKNWKKLSEHTNQAAKDSKKRADELKGLIPSYLRYQNCESNFDLEAQMYKVIDGCK